MPILTVELIRHPELPLVLREFGLAFILFKYTANITNIDALRERTVDMVSMVKMVDLMDLIIMQDTMDSNTVVFVLLVLLEPSHLPPRGIIRNVRFIY